MIHRLLWPLIWLYQISIKLLERVQSWWLAPLINEIIAQNQADQKNQIQDLKECLYVEIQKDAKTKWVNLNQILQATYSCPSNKLQLRYLAPQNSQEAIALLTCLAPIFDGYLKRSHSYNLLPILIYHYQALLPMIMHHVCTPSGLTLDHVEFQELGISGLLEAIACFAQGICEEEIPNQYLSYVGGLDEEALLALFSDLNTHKVHLDPDNPWPHLLGLSLQYSALQYYKEDHLAEEKANLQEAIIQALTQIMESTNGTMARD